MLKIRLQRTGKRGQAMYRIVVAEASKSQQSKTVDILGWYDPTKEKDERFSMDMAKYQEWVEKGAQANDSVLRLVLTKKEKEERWPSPVKKEETKKEEAAEEKKADDSKEEAKPEAAQEKDAASEDKAEAKEEKAEDSEASEEKKKD